MKKIIILLLLLLFLVTGCSVTYNIDIDEKKIKEDVLITDNYGSINFNYYDIYSSKPIPLSKNNAVLPESDEKMDGIHYYDLRDISNGKYFGLNYIGVFNKEVKYSDSSLMNFGVGDFTYNENNGKVTIIVPKEIKAFNQFSSLDVIKVKLKTRYKVISNNADSVSGNVYTWNLTRSNYKNKSIHIVYKTDNSVYFFNNPIVRFAIVLFIIVLLFFIICIFVGYRYKKNNTL